MLDAGGVTQKYIAGKIGITENTMSLKMNGRSKFTRDQMVVIQKELGGLPLDQLFEDCDSPRMETRKEMLGDGRPA